MNSINVIGRLTKNPELSRVDGESICTLFVAIDDVYSKMDRADFIKVIVNGVQGENCDKYLKKGFLVGVNGRIRSKYYKDCEGIARYPVSIIADRVQFIQWPSKE